jgi:hypothetical protein
VYDVLFCRTEIRDSLVHQAASAFLAPSSHTILGKSQISADSEVARSTILKASISSTPVARGRNFKSVLKHADGASGLEINSVSFRSNQQRK